MSLDALTLGNKTCDDTPRQFEAFLFGKFQNCLTKVLRAHVQTLIHDLKCDKPNANQDRIFVPLPRGLPLDFQIASDNLSRACHSPFSAVPSIAWPPSKRRFGSSLQYASAQPQK